MSNTSGLAGEVVSYAEIEALKALGIEEKDLPPLGIPTQLIMAVAGGETQCEKLLITLMGSKEELDKTIQTQQRQYQ